VSNENDSDSYEVGYGKTPRVTRFQKGRSGNPKGRPKGALNLATVLDRTLREPVVISENGQRKTITKMQAAVKQLVNQAASGELAALRQLMALVASAEQSVGDYQAERPSLNEADQKVMAQILQRFEKGTKGE
jgi:Family of unknown function (DUF5681)